MFLGPSSNLRAYFLVGVGKMCGAIPPRGMWGYAPPIKILYETQPAPLAEQVKQAKENVGKTWYGSITCNIIEDVNVVVSSFHCHASAADLTA